MTRPLHLAFVLLCLTPWAIATDYGEALSKGLLFFDAQRSGKLPSDNPIPWRADSCLQDGSDVGLDLSQSFFDSGDHVVFELPLAYTLTMMAYGLVEYGDMYGAQRDAALATLRWGIDWLVRAHSSPNELYVQVGDGDADHAYWTRPEDMTMARPSFKVDAAHPGSEPAAEAAAALAAASIVFRDDPAYQTSLLRHAQQLFDFADTHRGVYSESVPAAAKFYKSYSSYGDELLWGAAWLHRATSNDSYLSYITGSASNDDTLNWRGSSTQLSWDDKRAGAHVLLTRLLLSGEQKAGTALDQYKSGAESFACYYVDDIAPKTSAGLPWLSEWSPLQYVTSGSLLIAIYGDYLRAAKASLKCPSKTYSPDDLLAYGKKQADYILGSNPMSLSFMVGFGDSFPHRVHHRAASIPQDGKKYSCGEGFQFFQAPSPNPHVIDGAIVGGPDKSDNFQDARTNFQQSEPSTYIVAPFLGLLARLQGVPAAPISPKPVATPPAATITPAPLATSPAAPSTPAPVATSPAATTPATVATPVPTTGFVPSSTGSSLDCECTCAAF